MLYLFKHSVVHNPMKTIGDEWLLANLNIIGYYRVNYDTGNWERLLNQLSTDHQVKCEARQCCDDELALEKSFRRFVF